MNIGTQEVIGNQLINIIILSELRKMLKLFLYFWKLFSIALVMKEKYNFILI